MAHSVIGSFNNYVDKMGWVVVPKNPIFVRFMGENIYVEEVGIIGSQKRVKSCSMELLNFNHHNSSLAGMYCI